MAVDWQTLLGGGLMTGGALMDKESGETTEARQYLRNIFTSPNALANDFTGQMGSIQSVFEPYIRQQEKYALDDIQQRAIAGQPQSFTTAMGGPELNALRTTNEAVLAPRRQAFMGELGLNFLNQRQNAANSILKNSQPDPLATALSQLGAIMLAGGIGNSGGGGASGLLNSIFGGNGTSAGNIGAGIGSAIGGALGTAGTAAGGAASAAAPFALPVALAAAAAYGGNKIGQNNPKLADMEGWKKAALILGTGGIGGGILFGADKAQKAQKAEYRRSDLDSQADQIQEIGSFFEQRMSQLGLDTSTFKTRIQNLIATSASPEDEQGIIAREGGSQLLAAIQAKDPSIQSLNQVPGLRQEFIDWMMANTFTGSGAGSGGAAPSSLIQGSWASSAGF